MRLFYMILSCSAGSGGFTFHAPIILRSFIAGEAVFILLTHLI